MTTIASAFMRDANHIPITNLGLIETKSITYSALTTGAVGTTTLFTVTGVVNVTIFAACSVDLTGSGTVEVGISGTTNALIAQTTGTAIDAGEFWMTATPATAQALNASKVIGTDIIQTIGTATITAGTLKYYCLWTPVSADGNVVAA